VSAFQFDLWGDSVNLSSRMESTGVPMHIQVDQNTYEYVHDIYHFRKREVNVKGRGVTTAYIFCPVVREMEAYALFRKTDASKFAVFSANVRRNCVLSPGNADKGEEIFVDVKIGDENCNNKEEEEECL